MRSDTDLIRIGAAAQAHLPGKLGGEPPPQRMAKNPATPSDQPIAPGAAPAEAAGIAAGS